MTPAAGADVRALLEASRAREKGQTAFYRALAARAVAAADEEAVERLNDLHADEQHHLSRLTARLLELGHAPTDLAPVPPPATEVADLRGWEAAAREREAAEVAWYEGLAAAPLDGTTAAMIAEILASERHHAEGLRGKWMPA